MLRSPPVTRAGQILAYLLFVVAGLAALVWKIPPVGVPGGARVVSAIWVTFLLIGGITSAVGRISARWPGEYVGLPLIGAAVAMYAVAKLADTVRTDAYAYITVCVVLTTIPGLIASRWAEVNQVRAEALRQAKLARGEILVGVHRENGGR
jgi:hypothetical protein